MEGIIYEYINGERNAIFHVKYNDVVITPTTQLVAACSYLDVAYPKKRNLRGKELFIEINNMDGTTKERSLKFYTDKLDLIEQRRLNHGIASLRNRTQYR